MLSPTADGRECVFWYNYHEVQKRITHNYGLLILFRCVMGKMFEVIIPGFGKDTQEDIKHLLWIVTVGRFNAILFRYFGFYTNIKQGWSVIQRTRIEFWLNILWGLLRPTMCVGNLNTHSENLGMEFTWRVQICCIHNHISLQNLWTLYLHKQYSYNILFIRLTYYETHNLSQKSSLYNTLDIYERYMKTAVGANITANIVGH